MLGRQQIYLEFKGDLNESDELADIMSNSTLNGAFLALAREVGPALHNSVNSNMLAVCSLQMQA